MKRTISHSLIGLLSLSIGYAMYPILNKEQVIVTSAVIESYANQLEFKEKTISTSLNTKPKIKLVTLQKKSEKEVAIKSITDILIETENITSKNSEVDAISVRELNEWSISHKEMLKQTILENVPTIITDAMTEMIIKDNNFLKNSEIMQEPQLDENWAYNMEQDLRNFIYQNPASSRFTLLSLTCKQLTCEILGIEDKSGPWRKIYFSLLQTVPTIQLPNGKGGDKNISFSEGNLSYIYHQLKFKPSKGN